MAEMRRKTVWGDFETHSRCVSSEEVVTCLLGGKFANRGQYTKSITRQHDDVTGLAIDHTGHLGVRDELDGVSTTGVLSNADIVVIRDTICGVVDDVLQDRTESDSVEDFGLLFCREIDALGITSTFDVENTGIRPDVFVITDEKTVGISRQCCLSSARETEEEGDITLSHANVGGRVKRELAEFDGLEVVLYQDQRHISAVQKIDAP